MASPAVATPVKSHHGLFQSKTAGGRMPLTPSPRTSAANQSSSFTTPSRPPIEQQDEPLFTGPRSSRLSKSTARSRVKNSPKSNIARQHNGGSRRLDHQESDFALTGTGPVAKHTPLRSRREGTVRARPTKTTIKNGFNAADRFIPNRTASEGLISGTAKIDSPQRPKSSKGQNKALSGGTNAFDIGGRASLDDAAAAIEGLNLDDDDESSKHTKPAPDEVAYRSSIADACGVNLNTRILAFKPAPPESSKPIDLRSQYNRPLKPTAQTAQFRRRVLTAPERVLDAPGLVDDYYLNLLDWSSGNQVAIGLERSVYVWSAETGSVSPLLECPSDTYVSSVKWSDDGAYVGVGLGSGEVQIWDVEEGAKLRSMYGHDTRIGVLGWSKHLLSTGARSGLIFNHDVRVAEHKVAELVSHAGEVCGLEWRSDGSQLATGGNDNLVSIWDARSLNAPKFAKTNHRAAVKALSWCPWQTNLLATGGGSHDRHIHFWNTTTGARVNSIDTGSQVTSLQWSKEYKELASTSGFPDNSISLWSYPSLVKNQEIPAHESRVLHSCLSPDGQMLATAAADESLKFWKLFEKKTGSSSASAGNGAGAAKDGLGKGMTIR